MVFEPVFAWRAGRPFGRKSIVLLRTYIQAKLYAATQTYDEARHVEAFNKYIQTRQKQMYPITLI